MFRSTAEVYDLIYESMKDYAAEAAEVERVIDANRPGATSLLDVACGTGLHLEHLRHRFADVAGIDLDPSMLAVAQRRLPDVPLHEADMRDFDLGRRFDVVTCLFSSVGYMPQSADLMRAIGRMADHLSPGGVLIVDGWVRPDEWRDGSPIHVETASDTTRTVVRMGHSSRQGDVTVLELHHLVGDSSGVRHLVDEHRLRLFTHAEYADALDAAHLTWSVAASPMQGRDRYVGTAPLDA